MGRELHKKPERITADQKTQGQRLARFKSRGKDKKVRHDPKTVSCAICGKTVQEADTADTPIGAACKSHLGVV